MSEWSVGMTNLTLKLADANKEIARLRAALEDVGILAFNRRDHEIILRTTQRALDPQKEGEL